MKSEERHKLQQNELADFIGRWATILKPYQNAIYAGLIVALVAVGKTPVAGESVMMTLAVLLNLCSEADAFVAASFATFPPAGHLAFAVELGDTFASSSGLKTPRLPSVTSLSAMRFSSLAFGRVVLICSCSISDPAMLANSALCPGE